MHRSALLLTTLLICACTRDEAPAPPTTATANATATPVTEGVPKAKPAPEQRPDAPQNPATPPKAKRNLLQLPPELQRALALYQDAHKALEDGNEAVALERLDETLALQPGHLLAVRDKLALCRKRGLHEEALLVATQALESAPTNVTFAYEKARCQFSLEKPNEALTTLSSVLDAETPLPAARLLQMKALATLGDTEATLAAIEAAAAAGFTDTALLTKEPRLQPLVQHPRFQSALESMKSTKGAATKTGKHPVLRDVPLASVPLEKLVGQLRSNVANGTGWKLDLDLKDVDQQPVEFNEYRGNPLLVCVWGTWSVTSWKLLPHLLRLKELYKEDQLEVLLVGWENQVDYDAASSAQKKMLREKKIDLRAAVLVEEAFARIYAPGCPTLYFVDPQGKVMAYSMGYRSMEDLKALIDVLLGRA